MINLIVAQRVHPGWNKNLEKIACELAANTLSEEQGCLRYEWYRAETPHTHILMEQWTDMTEVHRFIQNRPRIVVEAPKSVQSSESRRSTSRSFRERWILDFCSSICQNQTSLRLV